MEKRSPKKAQVIIFAFFLMIILGALAAALLQIWESQVGITTLQQEGTRAFYIAQAGMSLAKGQLRSNWNWAGMDANNDNIADETEKADFSGGKYWVDVISRDDSNPNNRTVLINAHGWSGSAYKVLKVELRRRVVGANTNYTQVNWTWGQI